LIIKIIGLVFVVFSCYGFGLYKSNLLKKRYEKLSEISICVEKIKNQIRTTNDDIISIFTKSFNNLDYVSLKDNSIVFKDKSLLFDDKKLICDMFASLGSSDKKGECEIVDYYLGEITNQQNTAKSIYKRNVKIFNTFSLCMGLLISILII